MIDTAAVIITAAIVALFAIGAIGMNLTRPRRCPECGVRDTVRDHESWLPGRHWVCNDCEIGFEEDL